MIGIYGQLFVNKYGPTDANSVWYEALRELTPKALEMGMKRLISLSAGSKFTEYPPNCLQFKALCLAFYEELRLPKANEAFREIINQRYCFTDKFSWSHEVIKFVANRLPADFLMIEQEQVAFDLFKQAFDQVCSLVKQGHAIPNLPERLASRKPADKSVAHYHLQQIKQRLGVSR